MVPGGVEESKCAVLSLYTHSDNASSHQEEHRHDDGSETVWSWRRSDSSTDSHLHLLIKLQSEPLHMLAAAAAASPSVCSGLWQRSPPSEERRRQKAKVMGHSGVYRCWIKMKISSVSDSDSKTRSWWASWSLFSLFQGFTEEIYWRVQRFIEEILKVFATLLLKSAWTDNNTALTWDSDWREDSLQEETAASLLNPGSCFPSAPALSDEKGWSSEKRPKNHSWSLSSCTNSTCEIKKIIMSFSNQMSLCFECVP